jgi:RNA polymerase sigma-70 factor (ECF subfamily)
MIAVRMATLSQADAQPIIREPLEDELLSRACGGDRGAFRSLFERHGPAVRRYLTDALGDAVSADEATQETFVRAHSRLHTVRSADRLRAWLLGVAHRVFLEQCRKRKAALGCSPIEDAEPADIAPSPELELLGREADAVLAQALHRLSEERRSVLLLRLDHDLSYERIAEEMDWPVQKVKNEIHRARLQLRAYLSQYIGGAP